MDVVKQFNYRADARHAHMLEDLKCYFAYRRLKDEDTGKIHSYNKILNDALEEYFLQWNSVMTKDKDYIHMLYQIKSCR